ncbi:RrF2 family transcriptional regulator [Butyricicoccus sp. Marseille-Q5471]|uniref:RrF2 family transcriptional regulator n=1 Tax=Butyricicoccus sp. Marseille-Q5471 TaxID=3039493 RepID=UPI0024BD046E|nr:Rrf2 family transcriptional regulator [Butyricicoccus sp. Marseille-Q5471]
MDSMFSVAVHALVYLNHKACVLTSEALAENICTNPARVRKVMAKLKKAGFVETKEGSVGGYRFCGDAQQLSLAEVAQALDTRFVDAAWRSGDSDMECLVASGMADIMDELYLQLDRDCKERLRGITIADIDKKIFT